MVVWACIPASGEDGPPEFGLGIDVLLEDSLHLVEGRRVGLITNQTGRDAAGRHTIDRLAERDEIDLVALFSPEHGIRGTAAEGVAIGDEHDPGTGLPVFSLYGETRRPTPETLAGVEVLLFDIQDIGARYYTYVSTMALAMDAAGEAGIPFIVLDRPNPIGGAVFQGPVLDPAFSSFVGLYPVPVRHGMTPGELARLFRQRFGVRAALTVAPIRGWDRTDWFDHTPLEWIAPSPNMPSLASATHYPGTCLFEGTPLSVGRGTANAFQWIGAPGLDGQDLADRLNGYGLAGVRFEPVEFTPVDPTDGKFGGTTVTGIRFVVVDRDSYDPVAAGVAALLETRRSPGDIEWIWRERHFDRLAGNGWLRAAIDAGTPLDQIVARWTPALEAFRPIRDAALIYGPG